MLNHFLSLKPVGRILNVLLGLRLGERRVLVLILSCIVIGGCIRESEPQVPTSLVQTPIETPLAAAILESKTQTPLPTRTPPIAEASTTTSPAPASTLTRTPIPTSTQSNQSSVADSQLAFTSLHDGYPAIYTIDIKNGSFNRLAPAPMQSFQPNWSPDGKMVGFLSVAETGISQLFFWDVLENKLVETELKDVTAFSWSPDSQSVVLASRELSPENRYQTYILSVTELQLSILFESDVVSLDVQWSPANDRVLSLALLTRGQFRFAYILDLEGNASELPLKGSPFYLQWDPTGQQIAYDNSYYPAFEQKEIRIIGVDGANDRALTEMTIFAHDPQWSPNGDMITFQSYTDDSNPVINIKNLSTGETRQISSPNKSSWYPSWSSNGKHIAYLAETDDVKSTGYSLYVYSVESGETIELVDDLVAAYRPAWRP